MLTIRLSRTGKRKAPSYRIVLQDSHRDPWSPAIEMLGTYNPRSAENKINLKPDRLTYWLSQGAIPSNTVRNFLIDAKLLEGEKESSVTITKKRTKKLAQKAADVKDQAEQVKKKAEEALQKAKEAEEKAKADAEAAKAMAVESPVPEAPAPENLTEEPPATQEAES